jgi:ankyrin repeat protein
VSDDAALFALFRSIAAGDLDDVSRAVQSSPRLAVDAIHIGASRADAPTYFLDNICHHVYSGDTALHISAAAGRLPTAELCVAKGAHVRDRNRRGAEPLHYAADGRPDAQYAIVEFLIANGAEPNALDNSGVAALHRAVRNRCTSAVRALLDNGARPTMMNRRGSTPLHLAVQNTGHTDSGTDAAKHQQRLIIELLRRHGAKPTDTDGKGKTVLDAASSDWIRVLLA